MGDEAKLVGEILKILVDNDGLGVKIMTNRNIRDFCNKGYCCDGIFENDYLDIYLVKSPAKEEKFLVFNTWNTSLLVNLLNYIKNIEEALMRDNTSVSAGQNY